jgi:hypothetical protein
MKKLDYFTLHGFETVKGGFTRAFIEALGFKYPPVKGWLKSKIDTEVTEEEYERLRKASQTSSKDRKGLDQYLLPMELPCNSDDLTFSAAEKEAELLSQCNNKIFDKIHEQEKFMEWCEDNRPEVIEYFRKRLY